MPSMLPAFRTAPALLAVAWVGCFGAGLCRAEDPTPSRLLGAMPEAATSLALLDLDRLLEEGSAYAQPGQRLLEAIPQLQAAPPLAALLDACQDAGAGFLVVAGAEFAYATPQTTFRARILIWTREPLAGVADWTNAEGEALDLTSDDHEGVTVYALTTAPRDDSNDAPPLHQFHFALASEHTIVIAEDPAEVAEMTHRWREERTLDTERYARALTPQLLDSPLVILRHGLPASRAEGAEGGSDGAFVAGVIDAEAARWIARYDGPDAETNLGHCGGIKRWASPSRDGDVEVREWSLPDGYDDRESDLILGPMALFGFELFI